MDQYSPWLHACDELTAALDQLDGYRAMTDEEFAEAHADAVKHLEQADRALSLLVDEQHDEATRAYFQRTTDQLRHWMAPLIEGDRSVRFCLVAIRDAVRTWHPERRRLERSRQTCAA